MTAKLKFLRSFSRFCPMRRSSVVIVSSIFTGMFGGKDTFYSNKQLFPAVTDKRSQQ